MLLSLLVADTSEDANVSVTVAWSGGLAEVLPAEIDLVVEWVRRTVRSNALLLPCAAFGILTAAAPPPAAALDGATPTTGTASVAGTYHAFTTALFDRSSDGTISVVAVCAPFPWYLWLSDGLKYLRDAMKPTCHEIRLWPVHSGLVFDHWVKGLQAAGVPAAAASGAAFRPSLRAIPWWERHATDPMLTPLHEVALPPLHVLCKAFPVEQVRVLQSILLAGESLVVCSPFVQVASAIVVSLPCMLSPLPCLHAIVSFASASDALFCLTGGASRHVIGLCPSVLPHIIVEQYKKPFSTPCWIADARTGRVGRCPAAVHPQKSLVLLPPMERFKEVYRRGFAVQSELFGALNEGFSGLFASYRRGVSRATADRTASAAVIDVASSCGPSSRARSTDVALNAFLVRLGTSASWRLFARKLVEAEQYGRESILVPALRTGSVVFSGAAIEWSALSHSAACFQFHCARRVPELYALEWAMAGKPLEDSSTAGKKILGFFEKARDAVVTQFSGPVEVEITGCAQQFCQCDDLLNATADSSSSAKATASANAVIRGAALHSKTSGGVPSPVSAVLPADVIHHFDQYHPLLSAFTGGSSASVAPEASQEPQPPPQSCGVVVMVAAGIEAVRARARQATDASQVTGRRGGDGEGNEDDYVRPSGAAADSPAIPTPTAAVHVDPMGSLPSSVRGSPARTPTGASAAAATCSSAPARSPVANLAMDSLFGGIVAGEPQKPQLAAQASSTPTPTEFPTGVSPARQMTPAQRKTPVPTEVPSGTVPEAVPAKGQLWNMDDLFK